MRYYPLPEFVSAVFFLCLIYKWFIIELVVPYISILMFNVTQLTQHIHFVLLKYFQTSLIDICITASHPKTIKSHKRVQVLTLHQLASFLLSVLADVTWLPHSQQDAKWRSVGGNDSGLHFGTMLIKTWITFLQVVLFSKRTHHKLSLLFCCFLRNKPPESDSFVDSLSIYLVRLKSQLFTICSLSQPLYCI